MDWKAILHKGILRGGICILLSAAIVLGLVLPGKIFGILLYILPAVVGFLFILDFRVKKPDLMKPFRK